MKKLAGLLVIIVCFVLIFLLNGEKIFLNIGHGIQKFLYFNSLSESQSCNNIGQVKLSSYKKENELLRKHLNFLEESKNNFVMANVIGKKQENNTTWFILDQGSSKGIKDGLAVTDSKGALIGTISKVGQDISSLMPLFNQSSRISADIQSKSRLVSGIVQGQFGSSVKMKYVPVDVMISKNDTIVTSGLDENIKRGIAVGTVKRINRKPNDIFQELIVSPMFNSNFRIVSILIP